MLTPRRPQDFQNINADKSSSALDHRHRISIATYYDVPYFKTGNWLRRNVLGNWLLAPIYTYQVGEPADVQSGVDANLNGDSAGDRTIFNPKGTPGTGSGVTALKNSGGAIVAYLANNPNAQYITAGKGALPNSGRNTLQTRPINNLDLTAGKRFNFTERTPLGFSGAVPQRLESPSVHTGPYEPCGLYRLHWNGCHQLPEALQCDLQPAGSSIRQQLPNIADGTEVHFLSFSQLIIQTGALSVPVFFFLVGILKDGII